MKSGEFGSALREARIAAGFTIARVAEVIAVSVPYFSDVERGRRRPFPLPVTRVVVAFLKVTNGKHLLDLAGKERGEFCPHCGKATR